MAYSSVIANVARILDCKIVGFFPKTGLELRRSNVRASAWASHAWIRRAGQAREKKPTVRFPYNQFVLTRGFKNVVELSKIYSQLRPLCKFDTSGYWFREKIAKAFLEDQTWVDGSGNTPTKPVPASRRGRKPSRALQIIVEFAAVVSKHSSAILRVDG